MDAEREGEDAQEENKDLGRKEGIAETKES